MTATNPTASPLSHWELECRVVDVVCSNLGLDRTTINPDARFFQEIAVDSLDVVELIVALEEAFQVTLTDEWCQNVFTSPERSTLRHLAAEIGRLLGVEPQPRGQPRPQPVGVPAVAPFLQLGGRATLSEWLDGPLHYPLGLNGNGYMEYRRRTDGMRCIQLPAADVVPSGVAVRPARVPLAPFLIDAEPVSNLAYSRFLNSIGKVPAGVLLDWCGTARGDRRAVHFGLRRGWWRWSPRGRAARQPVILLSWYGAVAYALWAHRHDWRYYRGDGTIPADLASLRVEAPPPRVAEACLPSELQWEYAARGPEPRHYPWGDAEPSPELLRVAQHEPGREYTDETLPAADVCARLGLSPFGLHHMAGNVWQWCRDWYQPGATPRSAPAPTGIRSERGGSWVGPARLAECGYRRGRPPLARGRCLGFRCVAAETTVRG
jgi:formylglycine-generating enzyme